MEVTTCWKAVDSLQLPIHANPISTDGSGNVWGIPITLGDPNQFFSMQPAVVANNTYIATTAQCKTGNYSCSAIYGGIYEPGPNAFKTNSLGSWNGTKGFEFDDTDGITFFNDRMGVEGKIIPGLPFLSQKSDQDDPTTDQALLGLGLNSSFLQSALDLDLIPSKQWAYWGGDELNQIAGHVILGGYDQNRVSGEFSSFTSSGPLGFSFVVTSIEWTDGSGTTTDLMADTPYVSLGANIETCKQYIELPREVRTKFYDATDARYNSSTGPATYSSQPSGTLDITISGGYKVSISSRDLFNHGLTYDSSGNPDYNYYEDWVPKVLQNDNYEEYLLTFGAPFLASQYLVTDIENQKFYLAEAYRSTASANVKPLCTGGVNPTSTPTPTPTPTPGGGGGKTNVAAIAGGVGGGVAVLIIVGIILFFVTRHRRRAARQKQLAATATADNRTDPNGSSTAGGNGYHSVSQMYQYPSPHQSPVSAASPVFSSEKQMVRHDEKHLTVPGSGRGESTVEELPSSPGSGSDAFSLGRSSQTYTSPHSQSDQGRHFWVEMPVQPYR